MTQQQIEHDKVQEAKRHNKRSEQLEEKRQRRELGAKVGSSLIGQAGKVIGMMNDPSWYSADKQLVEDVANISYATAVGSYQRLEPGYFSTGSRSNVGYSPFYEGVGAVPGVMGIAIMPTIGANAGDEAAIETVAVNMYTTIRDNNSGGTNYEASDLINFILAYDSINTIIAELKRIYSICKTAKSRNRFYPKGLLRAIRVSNDPDLIDLAQLRKQINVLARKMNAIAVPAKLSVFLRHAWLMSNIFKDTETHKSQLYLFYNEVYYKYSDASTYMTAQSLDLSASSTEPSGMHSVQEMVSLANSLKSALLNDQTVPIMAGDIIKAFGDSGTFIIDEISDDFHIEALYSAEVLSQINGATPAGVPIFSNLTGRGPSVTTLDIWQDGAGHIIQGRIAPIDLGVDPDEPDYFANSVHIHTSPIGGSIVCADTPAAVNTVNNTPPKSSTFVNMYKDDVTPSDNIVATRLAATWDVSNNATSWASGFVGYYLADTGVSDVSIAKKYIASRAITSCGTELVLWVNIVDLRVTGNGAGFLLYDGIFVGPSEVNAEYQFVAYALPLFDWAPRMRILTAQNPSAAVVSAVYSLLMWSSELDNYAIISENVLSNMHEIAIMSEFGIDSFSADRTKTRGSNTNKK